MTGDTVERREQARARALADPTRYRIHAALVAAEAPRTVAELTQLAGVHHNAVRQHLHQLVAAGLVTEATEQRHARGRPRLLYQAAPERSADDPYRRLSLLLLDAARTGEAPVQVGRRVGRAFGTTATAALTGAAVTGAAGHADPAVAIDAIVTRIDEEGFAPEVARDGDHVDVLLTRCPYLEVLATDAEVVCELHRGLCQGMADACGGVEIVALTAHDPRREPCRLRLRVVAEPAS